MPRLLPIILAPAAAGALALAGCAPKTPPQHVDLLARGEYLVNNIGGCNDCHTPMTSSGPDMAHALQGSTLAFAPKAEMPWAPTAPAIAGIPGHYTQAEFAAFLQTGVRPDGSRPLPPMPSFRMSQEDALAITTYVAALKKAG